jgi:hypothetical protein
VSSETGDPPEELRMNLMFGERIADEIECENPLIASEEPLICSFDHSAGDDVG